MMSPAPSPRAISGIVFFAFLWAMILAPVFWASGALPPVWSRCSCVLRICVMFQPSRFAAARHFS
jgi:hypothetical protein